jgi:hypothetical protein
MTALHSLYLSGTRISGTLPDGLGRLSALVVFEFDFTRISGSFPAGLAGLASLETLFADHAPLSGTLPPDIGRMGCAPRGDPSARGRSRLKILQLPWVQRLSGTLPQAVSNISFLHTFDMQRSRLSGTMPLGIGARVVHRSGHIHDPRGMQVLNLDETPLSGTLGSEFYHLPALQELHLARTRISGTLSGEVGTLSFLHFFDMEASGLSGTLPAGMKSISSNITVDVGAVYHLDLCFAHTALSGSVPEWLGDIPRLRAFTIQNARFEGSLPAASLAHATDVNVRGNALSGRLPSLPKSSQMVSLDLRDNLFSTLPKELPFNLTHFYMSGNPLNVTAAEVASMLSQLPTLAAADVSLVNTRPVLEHGDCGKTKFLDVCSGSWVVRPSCFIGPGAPACEFQLQLTDQFDLPIVSGGVLDHLSLRFDCVRGSDNTDVDGPPRAQLSNCSLAAPMRDNGDGSFTATVPAAWYGQGGPIRKAGSYLFGFFHGRAQFSPSRISAATELDYAPDATTVAFGPRRCPDRSNTVPTADGSTCVCPPGYVENTDSNVTSGLSCHWRCHDEFSHPNHDGTACVCDSSSYDQEAVGPLVCIPEDYTPATVERANLTASTICAPCPTECASCQPGIVTTKAGWRLNGSSPTMLRTQIAHTSGRPKFLFQCPVATLCPPIELTRLVSSTNQSSLRCPLDRVGPLCNSCGPHLIANGDSDRCELCAHRAGSKGQILKCAAVCVVAIAVVVVLLLLVSWTGSSKTSAPASVSQLQRMSAESYGVQDQTGDSNFGPTVSGDRTAVICQLTYQSFRIVIGFCQVVSQLNVVLHVRLPTLFAEVTAVTRIFAAEATAVFGSCLIQCIEFYDLWFLKVVFAPMILAVVVLVMFSIDRSSRTVSAQAYDFLKQRALLIYFLIYPEIVKATFSMFNCRRLGEGLAVLSEDYGVACGTAEHKRFEVYAAVAIVVFVVGAPTLFFLKLAWQAHVHNEDDAETKWIARRLAECARVDDSLALDILRSMEITQQSFVTHFRSNFFYWEGLDMARKTMLVGMIVFVGEGSTAQICLALLLSFIFFAAHVHAWPCRLPQDNYLRGCVEAQIFLTCLTLLALKTESVGPEDTTQLYDICLVTAFVILVPLAFAGCLASKIWAVLRAFRDQSVPDGAAALHIPRALPSAEATHRAVTLYGAGIDDLGTLRRLVAALRLNYKDYRVAAQLSPALRIALSWVRDELGLATDDLGTIHHASTRLQVAFNPATDTLASAVARISDRVVANARAEEQGGIFLSHYQLYGPDVMELKGELERACPQLRGSIWYDKDQDPSEEEMRRGVRANRYFLLYLTEGVLERAFCRKEIRWALLYRKQIVLLWKQEGRGAVASFATFFKDLARAVETDGDDGLDAAFATAAIPYYTDGRFHEASMAAIAARLGAGRAPAGLAPHGFDAAAPRLAVLGSRANAAMQCKTLARELQRLAPALVGQVADRCGGGGGATGRLTSGVALVYLTEGLFDGAAGERVLDDLARALAEPLVRVVLVAETDMRHGWSAFEAATPDHSGWRDALAALCARVPARYYEQGALRPGTFADVIPFYKDKVFRDVSYALILQAIGAAPRPAAGEGEGDGLRLTRSASAELEPSLSCSRSRQVQGALT